MFQVIGSAGSSVDSSLYFSKMNLSALGVVFSSNFMSKGFGLKHHMFGSYDLIKYRKSSGVSYIFNSHYSSLSSLLMGGFLQSRSSVSYNFKSGDVGLSHESLLFKVKSSVSMLSSLSVDLNCNVSSSFMLPWCFLKDLMEFESMVYDSKVFQALEDDDKGVSVEYEPSIFDSLYLEDDCIDLVVSSYDRIIKVLWPNGGDDNCVSIGIGDECESSVVGIVGCCDISLVWAGYFTSWTPLLESAFVHKW